MHPEKKFILPAVTLDQPPPPEEWGTKIAQFRGVCYELFLVDVSGELDWPEGFPMQATCVIRSDSKGNHTVISDVVKAPEKPSPLSSLKLA